MIRSPDAPDRQEVVLIVDDEPRNIELLTAMLAAEGFSFMTASGGNAALTAMETKQPDLILLDVMMPGMDGFEVTRRVKTNPITSNIPVILITALDDRKSRMLGLTAGAEDFLTKPVDRAELRARARNLLRLKAYADYHSKHGQILEGEVRTRTAALLASETELRSQRDTAQRYLDTAQVMLLGLDTAGKITLVNRYACALLGWTEEELIGSDWAEKCLPASARELMGKNHAQALAGESATMENLVLCKSGEELLVEWRGTVMRDDSGLVIGTIASGTDITARSRAIRDLRIAEERMRFALVRANVGIWDVDVSGKVSWSDTLEAQYGLPPGGFEGTFKAFIDQVHPDDRDEVVEVMREAARAGGDFLMQHRLVQPDGSIRWMSGAGHYQLDDEGHTVRAIGISQDVTEKRVLESQYLQAQKMEAVGRLASGVAHDFNNLLTVITGFAEFAASDLPSDSQRSEDMAEIIKAADRAAALTQQLLAFSRQQVMHTAPIDVNQLVTDMSGMITRLIGVNVKVTLGLRPDLCPALADRGQVEQVLMNLVVNARDAMPGGGTILIETAEVELENSPFHEERVQPGLYVMFAVTDSGVGMTKETKARLFEPFYTTKKTGEGTGLGLSTSYGIIKQSNGHIWVYSEPPNGTTFKVYLPMSKEAVSAKAWEEERLAPAPLATETVLLVEDEGSVRDLAVRILREAGYTVLMASNGIDAELLFDRHHASIDLVLTDVVMPGLGGPELISNLKLKAPAMPVLYMSGYTDQSIANKAGFDSAFPFLQKPFTGAELRKHVRLALDGRWARPSGHHCNAPDFDTSEPPHTNRSL